MKKEVLATKHPLKTVAIISALSALVVSPIVLLPGAASAEPGQLIAKRECFLGICWNTDDRNARYDDDDDDDDDNGGRYDERYRRSYSDIDRIYRDVLGRRADRDGLRTYSRRLEQGWSLREVRRDLAKSRECESAINAIYRQVLGRNADRGGIRTYVVRLSEGWSLTEVRRDISNSREARERYRDRDRYDDRYDNRDRRNRDRRDRDDERRRDDRRRDDVPVYRSPNDINNDVPVYRSPNDINN
jgi:hypothetical protein